MTMVQIMDCRFGIRSDVVPDWQIQNKLIPQTPLHLSLRLLNRSIVWRIILWTV